MSVTLTGSGFCPTRNPDPGKNRTGCRTLVSGRIEKGAKPKVKPKAREQRNEMNERKWSERKADSLDSGTATVPTSIERVPK